MENNTKLKVGRKGARVLGAETPEYPIGTDSPPIIHAYFFRKKDAEQAVKRFNIHPKLVAALKEASGALGLGGEPDKSIDYTLKDSRAYRYRVIKVIENVIREAEWECINHDWKDAENTPAICSLCGIRKDET